jgi:hypothetical protein
MEQKEKKEYKYLYFKEVENNCILKKLFFKCRRAIKNGRW